MSEGIFKRMVKALTPKKADRCPKPVKEVRNTIKAIDERFEKVLQDLAKLEAAHAKTKH